MRSDAAPAINAAANYTMTGVWTWSYTGTGASLNLNANSTNWQATIGYSGTSEFLINTVSFAGAPSLGLAVGGNRYLQITAGNVDIQLGATLTVASTSVRDGAILTSGTVAAARLPTFGTAAAGIVPASGGGTTNFLRADGTWAAAGGGTAGNPTASLGLTAINGVATTYMRSDAAPALDVTIAPTWSGLHTFSQRITNTSTTSAAATTGAYTYGALSYSDSNNLCVLQSSVSAYNQLVVQNTSAGLAASADLTISNNNGTATTFYGNFGMNSSGWLGTAGTSTFSAPNVVYVTATSGDLALGTTTSNPIRFVIAGGTDAAIIDTSNRLGIGVGSPTAMLHLKAGTATASTAPLKFNSGTNLTTAEAGAAEFDGVVKYFTNDATTGRGFAPSVNIFRLTANGAAIGPAISNFFGANSAIQLVGGGVYEIEAYCYFTKTTAGTVTVTATSSLAPANLSGTVQYGNVVGGTATGASNQINLFNSTATGAAFGASGSLTTAVNHLFIVRLIVEANASASNLRINFTSSAGTVTPLRTSYYKVTKLPLGNTGVFVA